MDDPKILSSFWEQCHKDGTAAAFDKLAPGKPTYGISYAYEGGKTFSYLAGVESSQPVPKGFTELLVPAAQYAVFPVEGPMPGAIHSTFDFAFGEFLPKNNLSYGGSPSLEVYYMDKEPFRCEVWIPVK